MIVSRLAVIDLGSNTFHLLIVDQLDDGSWTPVRKDRRYVKLGSAGLDSIDRESIDRAIQVMKEFAQQIYDLKVEHTRAIGTAALREAENGIEVANLLEKESGIHIEIIDGQHEAAYILKGIQSVMPSLDKPSLIVDIGGGSVEFILFDHQEVLFAHSYKIGVAILYRLYHQSDPISKKDVDALSMHLDTELNPLIHILKEIKEYYLIGASGSFEVIQDVMPKFHSEAHWSELDLKGLDEYMTEVIHADLQTRKNRKEIPVERIDYIVVAYLLIRFILRSLAPAKLFYCDFALKEGVLTEMS